MNTQSQKAATLLLSVVLLCLPFSAVAEKIGDRIAWPPVFERAYGNPKVTLKKGRSKKVTFVRPTKTVIVKTPSGTPVWQVNQLIAQHFLTISWDRFMTSESRPENEVRLNIGEIIPIGRPTYNTIGLKQLLGSSSGNALHDAWWKVRMGYQLPASKKYHLGFATIEWDDPEKNNYGHYSFCLREKGGNPDGDVLYDFRAPWLLDRRPRASEGVNIHNTLKIAAMKENLYDWIYTQSHYRNCHVQIQFVPVSCEQVLLLQAFKRREGGNFRVFRKNCASMGSAYAKRLLPLDVKFPGERSFVDLPYQANDATVAAFGGSIAEVNIRNQTKNPTSKTKTHPAPNRKQSLGYQALLKAPEIN